MALSFDIHTEQTLAQKIINLNWGLMALIFLIAAIGFVALYSAAAGHFEPWASKQIVRFAIFFVMMAGIALIDIRFWYKISYPLFGIGFILLVIVEFMGQIGMGAQRWINLGFIQIQPSELMKIATLMALARYFHTSTLEDMRRLSYLLVPALMVLLPVGLVLLQPNLGTAMIMMVNGATMLFIAGAPVWLYLLGLASLTALVPLVWHFYMHDYQKQRVLTFLNPESDPLGSGYHITQSKIALGSGGIDGRGFLQGTQSKLNFLPEKQTDFIFTLWAEEWGLLGGVFLLLLFGLVFLYCGWIAFRCRHAYGRFLVFGLMVNFSLYMFINVAMVMGLIPVVGIPLPLVSYGGTAMMACMIGFGLIMSASIHRDSKLAKF
ncbi:MAG: rod shape-determining protein RodA [Micavibrio aeruginosavorus]|uniref:Peptidoglycan glycosyltransferase RodA n=1 Tax=Micavibrio aeruginosavorus TaxID=349221 RepID=A0A7T5R247_9BACT|nr:MAG: rod shape-determining protein RodA [Micavibrio aeruginosavorus]